MTLDESLQQLTPKQRAFISAYTHTASVTRAAEAAKVQRTTHYAWLDEEYYRQAFEIAEPMAIRSLEDEAIRRAYEGVDEPVFYQGEECGAVRKYSDSLMQFLLKGARPDKYRDRQDIGLSTPNGPLQTDSKIEIIFRKATDAS